MKKKQLIGIILSICSFSIYAVDVTNWTLSPNGIGPIKIEMTLKEAETASGAQFRTPDSAPNKAEDGGCYMATIKGINNLSFMILGDKIVRVNVNALPFSTEVGAKVGDTEQHVLALYHNQLLVEPHKYDETGHYLTLSDTVRDRSIRFESNGTKIIRMYSGKDNEIHFAEDCL